MIVEKDVLSVLDNATVNGKKVTLVGLLDRNLYVRTDKILQAAGGKWNKKEKAHIFNDDAEERIDQIILTRSVVIPKDEYNYFPSPNKVVNRLVELARIESGMTVLEPSAGRGAITQGIIDSVTGVKVNMYELNPENHSVLIASELPLSSVCPNPVDFLTVEPVGVYDRVVMNPPFFKQNDIKHVNHALNFLKQGGLLVSVMGAGVLFRNNKLTTDFRQMVDSLGGFFEELPSGSFKESGTSVETVIVVIPKSI